MLRGFCVSHTNLVIYSDLDEKYKKRDRYSRDQI